MPPPYVARAQELLGEGKYLNGLYDDALEAFLKGLSAIDASINETIVNRLKLGLGKQGKSI